MVKKSEILYNKNNMVLGDYTLFRGDKYMGKDTKNAGAGKPTINLGTKMLITLLIPITCMIFIGVVAYRSAVTGITNTVRTSIGETLSMINEYIDLGDNYVETTANKYVIDKELSNYLMGGYDGDLEKQSEIKKTIASEISSAKQSNEFINNIHIIPLSGHNVISTKSLGAGGITDGFLKEYLEEASMDGKKLKRWVDTHPSIDSKFELKASDTLESYQLLSLNKHYAVIVDVGVAGVRSLLENVDLGKDTILGVVTENGKEIIFENLEEDEESALIDGEAVFYGTDFYSRMIDGEEENGYDEIRYNGKRYLFMYSKNIDKNLTVCALVPKKTLTDQVANIKIFTITMIILSTILSAVIGLNVISSISKNMKQITGKLHEVSKGNLTVLAKAYGNDEFSVLANSTNDMINNTKNLVDKVGNASSVLDDTSKEVKNTSNTISGFSDSIQNSLSNMKTGMDEQNRYIQVCVEKTENLAEGMKHVSSVIEEVESFVANTHKLIEDAKKDVIRLGQKAKDTDEIVARVSENILALKDETDIISSFAETIDSISEQTNLLSLNAYIEAARAGESGRGFSVVAEEIRKLAENSAEAAGEISNKVSHISIQANDSVESAREAEETVAIQTRMVDEIIKIFGQMSKQMEELVMGLKKIVETTEMVNGESKETFASIQNITTLIEENSESADMVAGIFDKLLEDIDHLDSVSDVLNDNMQELKKEMSLFRTE